MLLLSLLFDDIDSHHWDFGRPTRFHDQHFGVGLSHKDLLTPYFVSQSVRRLALSPYYRPWSSLTAKKDDGSTVKFDKDMFQVTLDVQQFAPEEIIVKAPGENTITVEGKHEEKEDEHGYISRHFFRKYKLPKGHDISKTCSQLSSDGIFTITAPRVDSEESKHREIPVIQTGKPSKAITEGDAKKYVENGDASMEYDEKPTPKRSKR